ncbi:hypothetical protein KLP40_01980 [Hymenobacter sp. NST-14]|uniref:hypothetical protein n=1 Tax=Hymenobacter piscis TaxID=2839984 RepID=UPI001C03524A|nr:hypothetical protein [Hymenobacter piscis]MBT9391919.1 hypothetical protein [Hymenobacter piscis]
MNDKRKQLYRELLYWAMVDIRQHSYPGSFLSDLRYRRSNRKRLLFTHAVAQWLHNLAMYSAIDFKGFQEDWFWKEYAVFRQAFPTKRWASLAESTIRQLLNEEE